MCDVSVVIVSWNTAALVRQCLNSLRRRSGALTVELLLVDNASSDGTAEMVAREFPEVILIRNQENLGFAKANNMAIKRAKGKYIALVNSDVTVPPVCLQGLVDHMEQHCSIGMLGPKMLTPAGTVGASCMRRPSLSIWLSHALGLHSVFGNLNLHLESTSCAIAQEVDVLNGWFWLVRTRALDRVGLLDEQFFMYGEDIDWCHRFWKNGWKVVYFPNVEAVHYGEGSSSRDPVRFYVEMHRARLQYWRRHHGRLSLIMYFAILSLHQGLRLCGYGVIYALKPLVRKEAALKIRRSAACLEWLLNSSFRRA